MPAAKLIDQLWNYCRGASPSGNGSRIGPSSGLPKERAAGRGTFSRRNHDGERGHVSAGGGRRSPPRRDQRDGRGAAAVSGVARKRGARLSQLGAQPRDQAGGLCRADQLCRRPEGGEGSFAVSHAGERCRRADVGDKDGRQRRRHASLHAQAQRDSRH